MVLELALRAFKGRLVGIGKLKPAAVVKLLWQAGGRWQVALAGSGTTTIKRRE